MIRKTAEIAAVAAAISALGLPGIIAGTIVIVVAVALLSWVLGTSSRTRRAAVLINAFRLSTVQELADRHIEGAGSQSG